jgi:hypothetical protein
MCELFEQLKNKLGDHFPIPKSGIVAGQSVAQAYFDIHDIDIHSRYKDLDVFVESTNSDAYGVGRARESVLGLKYCSGAGEVTDVTYKDGYSIVFSGFDTFTNVNTIHVKFNGEKTAECIVAGFDINSAAIAIDIDNESVFIHPEFLTFIKTRELSLISIHTPVSSLIRIIGKYNLIVNSTLNMANIVNQVGLALTMRHYYNECGDKFVQGTGITLGRANTLPDDTWTVLGKYLTYETKEFTFYEDNDPLHEGVIVKGVIFKPIQTFNLESLIPRSVPLGGVYPYRSDLNVINCILAGDYDKVLTDLIDCIMNDYKRSDRKCELEYTLVPWFTSLLIKGVRINNALKVNGYTVDMLETYWCSQWLWENNVNWFDLEQLESFVVFYRSMRNHHGDNYAFNFCVEPLSAHLLREVSHYIKGGIVDVDFARKVVKNLTCTLKSPLIISHELDFTIRLGSNRKLVSTWDELVKVLPNHSASDINTVWDDILNNECYLSWSEYGAEKVIQHSINKTKLFQLSSGVVLQTKLSAYLKANALVLKDKLVRQIKNKLPKKKMEQSGFKQNSPQNIDFSSDIPF